MIFDVPTALHERQPCIGGVIMQMLISHLNWCWEILHYCTPLLLCRYVSAGTFKQPAGAAPAQGRAAGRAAPVLLRAQHQLHATCRVPSKQPGRVLFTFMKLPLLSASPSLSVLQVLKLSKGLYACFAVPCDPHLLTRTSADEERAFAIVSCSTP